MDRLVIGISGASGAILGIRMLECLAAVDVETHLVISDAAKKTIELETDRKIEDIEALASFSHDCSDIAAPIASGSFKTRGMVVIPCSMKTLSAIASSFDYNLLVRAADVALKERRPLIVVPRELPLHKGHLELMLRISELGGVVMPPVLTFYNRPQSVNDMIDFVVGKVLDALGIEHDLFRRWGRHPA
ncbi:MAG: UbiX family flavin prenyltransferase [Syntrophobacteraceae bacterium]